MADKTHQLAAAFDQAMKHAGSQSPMVIHRDIARVWEAVGGYERLLQLAEDNFESFLKFAARLFPKLQAEQVSDSDISETDIDTALEHLVGEHLDRKLQNVAPGRHVPRRAGELVDRSSSVPPLPGITAVPTDYDEATRQDS